MICKPDAGKWRVGGYPCLYPPRTAFCRKEGKSVEHPLGAGHLTPLSCQVSGCLAHGGGKGGSGFLVTPNLRSQDLRGMVPPLSYVHPGHDTLVIVLCGDLHRF